MRLEFFFSLVGVNMADIWDPERIRLVGSVLERYSAHLTPGHRIRSGMEGDEAGVYRASEAPCFTVLDVSREPNGYVKFRAQMDGSMAIVEFDNRNIAPGAIWEIEPEYLSTFRGHVERSMEGAEEETQQEEREEEETPQEKREEEETPQEEQEEVPGTFEK